MLPLLFYLLLLSCCFTACSQLFSVEKENDLRCNLIFTPPHCHTCWRWQKVSFCFISFAKTEAKFQPHVFQRCALAGPIDFKKNTFILKAFPTTFFIYTHYLLTWKWWNYVFDSVLFSLLSFFCSSSVQTFAKPRSLTVVAIYLCHHSF